MCITPEHFPKDSFIIGLLENLEEKTRVRNKIQGFEIEFNEKRHQHMSVRVHRPTKDELKQALYKIYMFIAMIYLSTNKNKKKIITKYEDKFIDAFDKPQKNDVEYASDIIFILADMLLELDDLFSSILPIPAECNYDIRITRVVLDLVLGAVIDNLNKNDKTKWEMFFDNITLAKIQIYEWIEYTIDTLTPDQIRSINERGRLTRH